MLVCMDLTLPRDARYVGLMRNVAVSALRDLSVPAEAIEDVRVAITEACANVVRHARNSAEYGVGLRLGGDGCEIEIVDVGPGFDPLGDELDAVDAEAESGRGLLLIRNVVDDFAYTRVAGRSHVLLTKHWPRVPGGPESLESARHRRGSQALTGP